MNRRRLTILAALTVAFAGTLQPPLAGQKVAAPATPSVRNTAKVSGNTNSVVVGHVLDALRAPVSFASVRLRNLDTAVLVDRTTSNHVGEFSFLVPGGPTYIAELIDKNSGRVLAVSQAVTVEAGETAAVIIQLPAQLPTLAGFFSNTAAAILSAAASAGIVAVEAPGQPVTPEK